MDWLTFVSKVVEALAWPVTIGFLVLKFRDRFQELLGKLTEVSLPGGITGKFEVPLRKAELLREQLSLDFDNAVPSVEESVPEADHVALSANPTGVIMEAWKELNHLGYDLIQSSDLPSRSKLMYATKRNKEVVSALAAEKLVPNEEIELLRELQQIRNRAAHSVSDRPTPDDAERFLSLVYSLKVAWLTRMSAQEPRD